MVNIVVIDGQGGGIGVQIVRAIVEADMCDVEIIALGTNAMATTAMMKTGANRGASGENAIKQTVPQADLILGSLAIIRPNAMMGELTPAMAEAIASSNAPKVLLPLNIPGMKIAGYQKEPLPHLIEKMMKDVRNFCSNGEGGKNV